MTLFLLYVRVSNLASSSFSKLKLSPELINLSELVQVAKFAQSKEEFI